MPKAKKVQLQLEGTSKTKQNLRSAKRFLSKGGISQEQREIAEQKIKDLEALLENTQNKNAETKNEAKYKGVRFVETKKVRRKIKQLKKALDEGKSDAAAQEQLLHARVDLHYTLNYPLDIKYIALFPEGEYVEFSHDDLQAEDLSTRQRQTIREKILDDLKAGTIATEPETLDPPKKQKAVKTKNSKQIVEEEEEEKQESEPEEEDAFFE